jgi:hypothetical protein
MISWLLHFFGVEPRSPSTAYNFWSGFGSDLTEFVVLLSAWKYLNCHEQGCWRVGLKTTVENSGHHYRRCNKHHLIRHG